MEGEIETEGDIQEKIDHYASGPDMLGNIDAFVISDSYLSGYPNIPFGLSKVSEILEHYYLGDGFTLFQKHRFTTFSNKIGLEWNQTSTSFSNFTQILLEYADQVNDAGAMYIGGQTLNAGLDHSLAAGGLIVKTSFNSFPTWNFIRCFFKDLEIKVNEEQ